MADKRQNSKPTKSKSASPTISFADAMRSLELTERERIKAVAKAMLLLSQAGVFSTERKGGADARHVIGTVLSWMMKTTPPAAALGRLRNMVRQTDLQTFGLRRARAQEDIEMMAPYHANDAAVRALIGFLKREDPELAAGIEDDIASFREKLARYDPHPKGKKGKASAATIIAETVYKERDALGLKVRKGAAEDEIARLRNRLARDRRKANE